MNTENRFKHSFKHFEKSFNLFCRRQKAYEKNPENEGCQMALVKSYEVLLELSISIIERYLEYQGYNNKLKFPKNIIRQAFQDGIIKFAEGWMLALEKSTKTVYVYHPEVLKTMSDFLNDTWFPLVQDLHYHLKKELDSVD